MDIKNIVSNLINKTKFKFPYNVDDYLKNFYFENYHCHKDFSNTQIADSGEPIQNYADRTKFLGGKCLYSGEHGSQGNQFEVYKCAEKNDLKYVHSSEVYWVKDRHEQDRTNCHMIICAKNAEGRKDLNFALSMANIDGYYYRPRIDLELLFNIPKDNIIITSACIAGWSYDDAADIWLRIHEHFGDNFLFELQANNTDKQKKINETILRLAEKNDVQTIIGLDSHYIGDIGCVKRDQILKYKNITYPEEEGWYMDYPDAKTIVKRFNEQGILSDEDVLKALMNTNIFVSECEDIVLDKKFKIPSVYKNKTYEEKCKIYKQELNKAYAKETLKSKEKEDGIRYEAKQVIDAGVVDYFLTSKKIVDNAVNDEGGILTTTSRGSAASFITNKLLGLTTVDRFNAEIPIYPERFLTTERVLSGQMPDIDLNIAEQEPFVKAAKKLLGEHGCYPLMAVEKLKEKAAWQLYAGVNNVKPSDANAISKFIDEYNEAIKYADEEEAESIVVEDFIPDEYINLFNKSNDYRGITINLKCHACGHFIFDGDIRKEVGLISAISETTGKRTICAAIEGKYLDEFGYVKEDFLIVDSVYLTHKFFTKIDKRVPSFDELKNMVKNDESTWKIYENGITCCVNQCEKETTTNRVKRYKPKNIAELSAFIAGIRPGFSSLINNFLDRKEYTTGEKSIDDILEDTGHYMIYQESIMKVLGYLGIPMNETYAIIKNISKKKYRDHPEMRKELKERLITVWEDKVGNTENFEKVWRVIEQSGSYAFNSPHAYSMGGDSLYQAWFKAHYTSEFYEVAINHYQEKGKKNKIDALVKEAIKFYGYKLGNYEFGNDNRRVNIDTKNHIIYPNLSSVKGFGETVVETLYELGKNDYDNFNSVINAILSNSINKTILEKLIKLKYFNKYGDVNSLLEQVRLYDILNGTKTIKKDKALKNNLPFELLAKYSNETEKQFNKVDSVGLYNELVSNIKYKQLSDKEELDNQYDILGIISYYNPDVSKNEFYVSDLDVGKSITNVDLYEIRTGKIRRVKIWTTSYNKNIFEKKDILFVNKVEKKNKRRPSGEVNPQTGKQIWVDVPDEYEYWLSSYYVKEE